MWVSLTARCGSGSCTTWPWPADGGGGPWPPTRSTTGRVWHDFGVVHITDAHVARRIDRFRPTLYSIGRPEAAAGMYNWNDRFRGFIRYANYLHGIGALDVILAAGDMYDYQFEYDDDGNGQGNALFLRDLLLGLAPGPDFPDVEELRVPIFMVPGNHDYRMHPYHLYFDVQFADDDVYRLSLNPPRHRPRAAVTQ